MRWLSFNVSLLFLVLVSENALTAEFVAPDLEFSAARNHLHEAFVAGFDGKRSIDRSLALLKQAERLIEQESLVEYARGLVLLRNFRKNEALRAFDHATDFNSMHGIRACQAALWMRASAGELRPAIDAFRRLGAAVAKHPAEYRTHAEVKWLGSFLAAVEQSRSETSELTAVQHAAEEVVSQLPADYKQAFDRGQDEVLDRLEQRQLRMQAASERKRLRADEEGERKARQLESQIDTVTTDLNDIKLDRTDAKASLDEKLDKLDRTEVRLKAELKSLAMQADRLVKQETALATQSIPPGTTRVRARQFVNAQANQRARVRASLAANVSRSTDILRELEELELQRQTAQQNYATRLRQIRQHRQILSASDKRLSILKRGNAQIEQRRSKSKTNTIPSFRSLLPFDIEAERKAILESIR